MKHNKLGPLISMILFLSAARPDIEMVEPPRYLMYLTG